MNSRSVLAHKHPCGHSSQYERLHLLGSGTFGEVWQARHKDTSQIVALKKIKLKEDDIKNDEGFPLTALREYMILKSVNHINVLRVLDIVCTVKIEKDEKDVNSIYMVTEYMEHDLTGLLGRNDLVLTVAQIKCFAQQLLTGLFHIHMNHIVHRDMKCSNILVSNTGILKLADFGLARKTVLQERIEKRLTPGVVTLWYRPPEVILGATSYDYKADVWGAGCIIAEMFTRKPIFDGNDRIAQMTKITAMCGTPSERNWEGVSKLPDFNKFKFYSQQRDIKRLLPRMSKMRIPENGINLLDKLLILNPADRIDAEMALDHDFFWTEPFPTAPAQMPTYPDTHEMDIRRPRERESSKISNNEANRPNNSNVSHQRSGQQMGHNDQRSHGDNSRRHHNNNINNNNRHGNRKGGRDGRNHKNRNRGNNTGNNNNRGERGRSPY